MHAVDRTVGRRRGGHRPQHGAGGAETHFLAFQGRSLLDRRVVQGRVGLVLGPQRHRTANQEQREHAAENRTALAQVLDVVAEGEHQRHRNQDDRRHFKQVGPGSRVFERMRRVDPEEATAVGPQLLDRNLAGRRAEWDHLIDALHRQRADVVSEGLRHALPDQKQRQHQAQWQQAIEGGAGHIHPEIAQGAGGLATNPTAKGDKHRKASGRTDKVLHGQADHLAQVAEAGFTAVGLPVGVGHETDGGVERLRPFLPRQLLRVERQVVLEQQDRKQQQKARQVEGQQGQGVLLPTLFLLCIDPGHAITHALDRPEHWRKPSALPFHHLVVEPPQKWRWNQHHGEEGDDQPIVITVHSRS